jgi:electron transfer flavoprotein alpha subunit
VADVVCCLFAAAGFDRAAVGILGAGRRLADSAGGKLVALVLGPANEAVPSGAAAVADRVLVADEPALADYDPETYLSALAALIKPIAPGAVLLGSDSYSQELTPRLAHRLGGSAAGDAVAIATADGHLHVTRGVYGGKAVAVLALKRAPGVVWMRARAMDPADVAGRAAATPEKAQLEIPTSSRVMLLSRHVEAKSGVRLEEARLIVSGGRGLGGPEPFKQLQELADAMGAQMAASRAACDAGWVPPSWQVGQTGKKVAPELYMAIAISGASQHIMGIADSKVICAINRDPDAPIFKHCRFGLVEDYQKVIGPLREAISQSR